MPAIPGSTRTGGKRMAGLDGWERREIHRTGILCTRLHTRPANRMPYRTRCRWRLSALDFPGAMPQSAGQPAESWANASIPGTPRRPSDPIHEVRSAPIVIPAPGRPALAGCPGGVPRLSGSAFQRVFTAGSIAKIPLGRVKPGHGVAVVEFKPHPVRQAGAIGTISAARAGSTATRASRRIR